MTPVRLLIFMCVLLSTSAMPAAAQFPLLCRGGPDMQIRAVYDGTQNEHTTNVTVNFRRATVHGAIASPRPGHCTWLDRTLNSQEPTNFTISAPWGFSFHMSGSGRILFKDEQPILELGGLGIHDGKNLALAFRNILKGDLFIVVATNTGGTLTVSEVRHAPQPSSAEQKP